MPPDFLNSREDAILVWALAIIAFALYEDFRGVGGSTLAAARAFLQYKLLLLFGGALVYSALLVYAASRLGLWHRPALKETSYWFVGTAIVVAGESVTAGARDIRSFLARVLRRVLAITLVIEFVVNVYAMPFLVELVGVFLLLAFTGVRVVVERDASTPRATRTFVDAVLVLLGIVYLSYFVARVADDPGRFFNRDTAEVFLVAPALTIALIPYFAAMAGVSRWEQQRIRRRFRERRTLGA